MESPNIQKWLSKFLGLYHCTTEKKSSGIICVYYEDGDTIRFTPKEWIMVKNICDNLLKAIDNIENKRYKINS